MSEVSKRVKQFLVEYEIIPLRAIHHEEFDANSEEDLREQLKAHKKWKIRKVTEL